MSPTPGLPLSFSRIDSGGGVKAWLGRFTKPLQPQPESAGVSSGLLIFTGGFSSSSTSSSSSEFSSSSSSISIPPVILKSSELFLSEKTERNPPDRITNGYARPLHIFLKDSVDNLQSKIISSEISRSARSTVA